LTIADVNGRAAVGNQRERGIMTSGNMWLGGSGADTYDGGDGDDIIIAGAGSDTVDGGSGSDVVLAGLGNDTLIYNLSENLGTFRSRTLDVYDGGIGVDTLRLELTLAQWASPTVQNLIHGPNGYLAFLQTNNVVFRFAFDADTTLMASRIERLTVHVDGAVVQLAGNDPVVIGAAADLRRRHRGRRRRGGGEHRES
jgi:hypothetical protein